MATTKKPKARKKATKKIKLKLAMPKVLAPSPSTKPKEASAFPVDHYSASSMRKFSTNPILFKIQYINKDRFETTTNISAVVGQAFHNAMEVYHGGADELKPSNEQDAIKFGMIAGQAFIENYIEGFINYSQRIPNKQKAYEIFAYAYNSYVQENRYDPAAVIAVEDKIEEAIDVEWRGQRLVLPVPLKGYIDKVYREDDKLKIKDYKTCASFSNGDKIDGAKILQAVTYYLLAYAKYGEEPYSVVFEEVKTSKNADGTSQVRRYEMVFAENDLFFDFYFRFYEDMTRALNGEMVFIPNVDTMFDNEVSIIAYIHRLDEAEDKAKLMKKHKVSNITDLLKKEMQTAGNMRKLMQSIETNFVSAKNLNYENMKTEEKIQTKLMEHGLLVQFDDVIHGASIDLYRFTPSIGLKMSRIKNYAADIEQVLGVSGIRVLAPIQHSTMIGFEIPRAERSFPTVPKGTGFDIAIGQTVMGEARRFDIRLAPHLLVAGASGSGKSVFLNALIEQLRRIPNTELYLYDPKMVELSKHKKHATAYAHSPESIMKGLLYLEKDMDARYAMMAKKGVSNISETDMPYKFVIIDEFGDFIIQGKDIQKEYASKKYASRSKPWLLKEAFKRSSDRGSISIEIEEGSFAGISKGMTKDEIAEILEMNDQLNPLLDVDADKILIRLAQKARACGIHFIIATQSPRVDVISGMIKNNFPTKIVFRTGREMDSRIVIDEAGAEKLLGKGDMLFVGENGVERLQGYISKQ